MKNKKTRSSLNWVGVISFFVLIAFVMQMAILCYDYIREKTSNISLIALLILVEIIIFATFCTIIDLIRRKIMVDRPTKKILQATEKIANGDFSTRLEITHEYGKYNEYDLIFENLNKMATELQKNEVLKTDFISNVSHEIKTPLAVIQNYATLLSDDSLDAEMRKSYSKTLISASKRITDLITNILKLNKLENQEIQEKPQLFNLTDSLSESVVGFETLIENKNIELNCDFDDLYIFSSKSLLEIVWNNLISNAIKFTPNGGSIDITLKRKASDAQISVKDTGCGMSSEVGARIFEKFYQGDTSHSTQGNGLGLALVKKVIDILGGEITVQSQVDKGSTFTILLKGVVHEN
ncbi:MAG: HAMP domain-containing histidine kinase [Clostridiales bacterium]|nr:HAMP domain-containing histidine kinase [Clostridiales bacterium]